MSEMDTLRQQILSNAAVLFDDHRVDDTGTFDIIFGRTNIHHVPFQACLVYLPVGSCFMLLQVSEDKLSKQQAMESLLKEMEEEIGAMVRRQQMLM